MSMGFQCVTFLSPHETSIFVVICAVHFFIWLRCEILQRTRFLNLLAFHLFACVFQSCSVLSSFGPQNTLVNFEKLANKDLC